MSSLSSNNVIYGCLVVPNVPDEETGEKDEIVISRGGSDELVV